jgi:hypothetical protein
VEPDDLDAFRTGALEIARTMLGLGFLTLGITRRSRLGDPG